MRRGYELKDLAKHFGHSIVAMEVIINEIIDEEYSDLPVYIRRTNIRGQSIIKSRPTWEDLRYFILAQEIQSFAARALTIKETASSFYSPNKPNGLEEHFITRICKKVLKNTYRGVKVAYLHGVFEEIIIHSNDPRYEDFMNDVRVKLHCKDSRGRAISRLLAKKYIHETGQYSYLLRKISVNKELSVSEMDVVLKCAIYGIVTPLLEDCYKARLTPQEISNRYGFFASASEVVDWTREIFEMEPWDVIRLLITGDLGINLVGRYGVKI